MINRGNATSSPTSFELVRRVRAGVLAGQGDRAGARRCSLYGKGMEGCSCDGDRS